MDILILRVSAIGDVVHTLPAIHYLKHTLHARISWVVQQKAAALITQQPCIDNVFILPNKFLYPKHLKTTYSILRNMQKISWNAIIDFQGLTKTSIMLPFLKGPKFGFTKTHARETLSTLFTHHRHTPTYTNIIQKNLSLASHTAQTLKPALNTCPNIHTLPMPFHIPEEQKRTVDTWLDAQKLTRFVTIVPNTTWDSKEWPTEYWHELLQNLHPIKAVLVGKNFGKQAHALSSLGTPITSPDWDLLTIARLIQKSALVIAPDTGILHLADLLKTETIGIFGPTWATKHGPFLTQNNIQNAIQVPCPHVYKKSHGATDCMRQLKPAHLLEKMRKILS